MDRCTAGWVAAADDTSGVDAPSAHEPVPHRSDLIGTQEPRVPETSLALDPCECKNGGSPVGVPGPDATEARSLAGPGLRVLRRGSQALRTASACGPLAPWTTSNSTR